MGTYILRRILLLIPTLMGVTWVVFFVMAWSPGGYSGVVLNEFGGLTEGQDMEQIRQYTLRRYGLDQPLSVQYGRWLNQVSPIGFLSSDQVIFTDEQKRLARDVLESGDLEWDKRVLKRAHEAAISLAGYWDTTPEAGARRMVQAVEDPGAGLELLEEIMGEEDAHFKSVLTGYLGSDLKVARRKVVERLSWEMNGRKRVLFARPAFKWPDLGQSRRGRKVSELLTERVPITLLLNVITIPVIYAVSIITGIYAARHRGKFLDVGSGFLFLSFWSIPTIWAGVMLIGYLANQQFIQLFPTAGLHDLQADAMPFLPSWPVEGFQRGWLLDVCWHLALPVFCLTYGGFAVLSKLTRGSILENLSADFVRTARAKGVNEHDVLFRHVLRNSILPLITVAASILPSLLVGSVIVETIFSIQGMGKLAVDAAYMKDQQLLMGTTLIGALIGLFSELMRDVCYAIADPRVSYE